MLKYTGIIDFPRKKENYVLQNVCFRFVCFDTWLDVFPQNEWILNKNSLAICNKKNNNNFVVSFKLHLRKL